VPFAGGELPKVRDRRRRLPEEGEIMKPTLAAALIGCLTAACVERTAKTSYDAAEEQGLEPAAGVLSDELTAEEIGPMRLPPDAMALPAQGQSSSDLRTTRLIREALDGDESLSFLAKNVTVTTLHGRVTLRGAVGSFKEVRAVENLARKAVGDVPVDNQLEISSP
jgi:hypothetical protein